MGREKVIFCGNNTDFLLKELTEQSNETNGGTAFRIPSLIKSGDTLIAVIDRQTCGADWGYIELAVRRSTDGGETWSNIETIASPPARETRYTASSYASAFFIDPCMAIAPNGDVILLVDFYPECMGLHNTRLLDKKKIPYSQYNGRMCQVLYDRDDNMYIVGEDGNVVDGKRKPTDYRVTDWRGSLYKGEEYVGNIYLNGKTGTNEAGAVTTFGAPLKAPKRNYVFMLRSSDHGKTWSEPKDVTMDFLKKEDGTFIGVAPGVGITTSQGRIIMPLYVDRKESVSIFSVDDGETWHRMTQQPYSCNVDEWQMVQSEDGIIFGIGRQKNYGQAPLSVSNNDGKNWTKLGKTGIYAPKCQKSVISVGEFVFCSHPSKRERENGVISVGKFIKSKGRTIGIRWFREIKINRGFFGYSCLCQIDDTHIGVLYEAQPSSYICYKTFRLDGMM